MDIRASLMKMVMCGVGGVIKKVNLALDTLTVRTPQLALLV